MKICASCGETLEAEDRVKSRKKFCSLKCKSRYRTISGARIDTHLWVNFRIREEDYLLILKTQGNKCAICYRDRSEFDKNFAVDHDHRCCPGKRSCGKCIRGLICLNCNTAMGSFQDNPETIRRALMYLERYQ